MVTGSISLLRVIRRTSIHAAQLLVILSLATACGSGAQPSVPAVPESIRELPIAQDVLDDLPELIDELPFALDELGLPDISQIADLPQLDDLPSLQSPPGGIVFSGPTEFRLKPGETIPGTDIRLVAITEEGAEFSIANLRSVRAVGDSLDFDGNWPEIDGVIFNLRTRIYRIAGNSIRAAGVHQMTIEGISPTANSVVVDDYATRFLYISGAKPGEQFAGMTLGYVGADDRGGELSGLPPGDYPYRKVGDSISWQGSLRSDIPVAYNARMLLYGESSARIGGTVKVSLPTN